MPLISHEIPKTLFSSHNFICDYPYLLSHLLLKEYNYDKDYASFYKECVKQYEYSVLDNSCYELGKPVETEHLINLSLEYEVSHIVLPDAYKSFSGTVALAERNLPLIIGKTSSKLFAVVQGNDQQEMLDCYDYFDAIPEIDIIGINFIQPRYSFFKLLKQLRNIKKKIHLLGCSNPGELTQYTRSDLQYIHSIDTSSPIVNGWKGNLFTNSGLEQEKPKEKIADNLDIQFTAKQRADIAFNIRKFREFVHKQRIA
jgi:hypothetical protein